MRLSCFGLVRVNVFFRQIMTCGKVNVSVTLEVMETFFVYGFVYKVIDVFLLLLIHDLFIGLWLFSMPLSKNKLDGWKLKTKFDIQYSMSVVHYVENVFYLCGCWETSITY